MSIRSFFTMTIVTFVFFASALPEPVVAQAPTVVLAPQVIVATKPEPRYKEMKYCSADSIYFTFEPASKYSSNEYILFYYMDENKEIAHDEAPLSNLTVVTDDTVTAPEAQLVRAERGQKFWNIIVTAKMTDIWNDCLGKLKTR